MEGKMSQAEMTAKLESLNGERAKLLAESASNDEITKISQEIGRLKATLMLDEGIEGMEVTDADVIDIKQEKQLSPEDEALDELDPDHIEKAA